MLDALHNLKKKKINIKVLYHWCQCFVTVRKKAVPLRGSSQDRGVRALRFLSKMTSCTFSSFFFFFSHLGSSGKKEAGWGTSI